MKRWHATRRARGRAVAEIIGAILLVVLTITAGVILWTFHFTLSPSPPSVGLVLRSGGSNPVWGDPTDCQPQGHWNYPLSGSTTITNWNNGFFSECTYPHVAGNYSLLNTSQFIVSQVSSSSIPLADINLTFLCNGTVLLEGSLASMTWFPGSSFAPAANAPYLGRCGTFNAGGYRGGAFGTLYNRLGIFVPISAVGANATMLRTGDTFLLYIHNGGYPLDYACTTTRLVSYYGICPKGATGGPLLDFDDYHGAPPWCFTNIGQCTIDLTYSGTPASLIASIPVYSLAPPTT